MSKTPWEKARGHGALLAVLTLAVALAYGAVLPNGFSEIDDPSLLDRVRNGLPVTSHFRPLYPAWNTLLFRLFGLNAWPYYAAGLALHVASAFACALLVGRLAASAAGALTAGLVFALFYSPHQAVLWIAANCGLLSVAFVLLAALLWHRHVTTNARPAQVLALLASAAAMASKEDSVVLAPLLVGVDLCVNGRRALAPRTLARRYAPFVVLGLAYIAIAFRPSLWADMPGVDRYDLRPGLVAELFGNFALLFAIGQRHPAETSAAAVGAGALLVAVFSAAAILLRGSRGVIWTGLAVALFALAPALPGPFQIAGSRYAYPASIGVAFLAGGIAASFARWTELRPARRALRACGAIVLASWLGLQTAAIRSVEAWRYQRNCARLHNLIEGTREIALALRGRESEVWVLAPDIWNPVDFECGVRLFLEGLVAPAGLEWLAADDGARVLAALDAKSGAAPAFTSAGGGRLERLDLSALEGRLAAIASARRPYAGAHEGELPLVRLRILGSSMPSR
jgi:hypothetical protein